ncbi:MAG: hypothetical protein U9Q15_04990 [Patescibacteria group bacterium]|nr:hypothetical protein [Patescibacteria group bacterium]
MQPGYWAYYTYQVQVDEDITLDDQQNNSDLFTHSNTTITTAGIDAQVNSFSAYRTPPNFLFGENAGYISVRPLSTTGITVTDSDITGWIYGENIGWISFNGSGYSVTNDTAGQLDGYAWNEHTGFIDMKGGNHAVTINGNGVIEGYAWSEGLGYINFYDGLDPEVSEYTAQTAWRPKGVTTTFRKTLDTDNNGRIDTIQIATNKNLNDDFTDLKITLSGANLLEGDSSFTASGTDITTGDTANDNIFTFSIPEIASGYNTEAVGTLTIDQNTLLQSFGYATTGLLLTNSSVLHLYDGAGPILENIYYDENNTNTTTDDSVILDFNESPRLLNSQMHPQGILGYGNGKTLGTGAYISTDALPSDQVRIILDNTEVGQLPIQDSDTGSVILGSMIDTSYNPLIFTTSPLIQDINNPRPQTASTKDINADGYIDTVEIIFNENIAISGGSSHDGIFVDGYSIAGSNISGDTLSLTLTQ